MKKIASCILAAILAATVLAEETSSVDYGQATQAPTLDLIWRFERETTAGVTYAVITGVAVTSGDNPAGEIDVPVSLVASDGTALIVKKIGANAFQNQIGITSVSIPYQIQSVGPGTFSGCTVLSSINVDSSNPWLSSSSGVLYDKDSEELIACPAITESVSLPQSLKKIGEEAFADCFRLKDITIPTSVKSIGTNAFLRCTRLDSITFNGDAPTVGATPFNGTKDGMTVYVPQDNKTYGEVPGTWNGRHTEYSNADGGGGSGGDDGVEGYYTDDDGVIWAITVYGKSNTAELGAYGKKPVISTSASGMLTVPCEVILNNGGAESILTSKKYSVKSIPDGAFSGCDKITGVNIPASIASIGSDAFNGCTSLTIIAVSSSSKYYSSRNGILYSKDGKTLVKVPAKTSFAATFTEQETATKKDIVEVIGSTDPTTMTTDPNQIIEQRSYGSTKSTTVTEFTPSITVDGLLNGVTYISDYAFTDCGLLPEASTVSGMLVVKVNGKETERKTGTFQLPVGTDSKGWENYSYLSSRAGFYRGSVCLYHVALVGSKTITFEIPITIPATITCSKHAFDGSYFTSQYRKTISISASSLSSARYSLSRITGGEDAPYGPFTPGVPLSLLFEEHAGSTAKGIPAGLRWTQKTGVLEGTPTRPGLFAVQFSRKVKANGKTTTETTTVSIRIAEYPVIGIMASRQSANGSEVTISREQTVETYVGLKTTLSIKLYGELYGTVSSVTVKGLPSGMKLVKTPLRNAKNEIVDYAYSIEGYPTRTQESKTVTLNVSNRQKWSGSTSFSFKVLDLPEWVKGNYNGVCFDEADNPTGTATANFTTIGKLSGKVMIPSDDGRSALNLSCTAPGFSDYDTESKTFSGTATMRIGKEALDIHFTLAESKDDGTGSLKFGFNNKSASLVQNIWNRKDLDPPAYKVNATTEVGGLMFKLAANGKVIWSGRIEGDNGRLVSVSGTCLLLNGPTALVYIPPRSNLVGGRCELVELWQSE